MIKKEEFRLMLKGGGNFVHLPPAFSANGQYFFLACRNLIYCYNTKTGKKFLELKGLSNEIISFDVYISEGVEYVGACSVKGKVIIWKADIGLKMKQTELPHKVIHFKIVSNDEDVKAVATWEDNSELHFGHLDLETLQWKEYSLVLPHRSGAILDFGGSGANIFVAFAHKSSLKIAPLNGGEHFVKTKISGHKFTCIKCHPKEDCILTGDDLGRVMLWYDIHHSPPTYAIYHWHTLPVQTIAFSTWGRSFYSGGQECVLVKWNADNPLDRKYLPRLPSPISQITVANDNLYVAISTADNAIHVVDAHFGLVSNVQQLVMGEKFPAGFTYDPRTKAVILNGIPGHLQFYSPHNMQLLYNVDIAGVNKLTPENYCKIENLHVTSVSVSRNASWMATIEERDDPEPLYYESRLKFWKFNAEKQTYELNTSVEFPHKGKATAVKFQPSNKDLGLRCITIGDDKMFKVWVLVDTTTVYNKGSSWRCAGAAFYKDLTPQAIAFSCDGSLLAIPFDDILTTWLPDSCENKCSLVHPALKDRMTNVAFGSSSSCHLLVATSERQLTVWNLLTLSMIWAVKINVLHLVSDIMFEHMAVITTDNKLFVFYPHSSKPIYEKPNISPDKTEVLSAVFIPNSLVLDKSKGWHLMSDLVIINSEKELFCLTARNKTEEASPFLHEEENYTVFGQTLPSLKSTALHMLKPVSHSYTKTLQKNYLDEFLNSPIQTMIPVRYMCGAILKGMVFEKQKPKIKDSPSETLDERNSVSRSKKSASSSGVDCLQKLVSASTEQTSWVASVF